MSHLGSSHRSHPIFNCQNSVQVGESSMGTEDEYDSSEPGSLGEVSHATDHVNGTSTHLPKWPSNKKLADIDVSEPLSFGNYKRNRTQTRNGSSGYNSYIVIHPGLKTDVPSFRYGSSMNDETPHKYLTSPSDQHEIILTLGHLNKTPSGQTKKSMTAASSELASSKPSLSNGNLALHEQKCLGSLKEEREETREMLKETDEDHVTNEEEQARQAKLIARLKSIVGTEGNNEKFGWNIFIKDAARARISTAFLNAKDHAIFDASRRELEVIADKTYIQKENKSKRMSFRRKKDAAPKLRKILERHGIISKKNLEKKNLKRVLQGLTRRKSKITYMKGNFLS